MSLSRDARLPASNSNSNRGLLVLVAAYRFGVAVLTAVALAFTAYRASLSGGLGNFFSYFTILSNILGTVVFFGGAAVASGRRGVPDLLRGAAALYLVITGIVYGIALAHYDTPEVIPRVNIVVHRVTPAVFAVDWLIDPPRRAPRFPRAFVWLVFPVLYLLYTLIRGPVVGWYPYPFLDPRTHGYVAVTVGCLLVAAAFVAVSALLCWVAGRFSGLAGVGNPNDNRRR